MASRRCNVQVSLPPEDSPMPRTRRAQATGQEGHGKAEMTKTEAVRRALRARGGDAKPKEIQDFVAREFGIDISVNHVSNIKSGLSKKKGKSRRKNSVETTVATTPVASGNGRHRGAVTLTDIEAAKQLAQRVGVRQLHALIDLVAR